MSKMEPEQQILAAAIDAQADASQKLKRKRLFAALGLTVVACASAYGAYEWLYASKFVTTDNAYTAAETAQVTPAIAGIVRDVRVTDTQHVRAGDVIVTLDDADARLALAQAEAELGRAVRRVRGYAANDDNLAAQVDARQSDELRA